MKALVKMVITLCDSEGHEIIHDACDRVYETIPEADTGGYSRYNKHIEKLDFGWRAIVDNDIH